MQHSHDGARSRHLHSMVPLGDDARIAIDAAWTEVIGRRLREVEQGTVKLQSAQEVFAEVRTMLDTPSKP